MIPQKKELKFWLMNNNQKNTPSSIEVTEDEVITSVNGLQIEEACSLIIEIEEGIAISLIENHSENIYFLQLQ